MIQQMQTILEDSMMDQSAPESRRDSYAVSPVLFSPKAEEWHHVDTGVSNNPFFAHSAHSTNTNPFMQMDSQQPAYQFGMWSGAATPTATYGAARFDGLPAEYDAGGVSAFSSPTSAALNLGCEGQTPFTNPTNHVPMFRADSEMSHQQDGLARKRHSSPLLRSHNELRRGDGIRKKNARFEIPAERNLNNIDQLISQSTDEQEIKELKQQKRLLRNRQAALDSRQRKKQHTERLEDEKKHFTELIASLGEQIQSLQRDNDQLTREKGSWEVYVAELEQKHDHYVTELVSQHTQETGDLRKKISVLTNHIQQMEGGRDTSRAADEMMVTSSTATAFPGASFFDEMSGLSMDTSVSWDDSEFTHFGDPEPQQPSDTKHEMQLVPATAHKKAPAEAIIEKPSQQGGLLFMLFLVGAFVLSKQSASVVPRVSEDVRVASATILDNVLKDAGLSSGSSATEIEHALAPGPSGVATAGAGWAGSRTLGAAPVASVAGASLMDTVVPSALGSVVDSLTQPTQQQANEDAFSMTAAQYIDVTGQDFLGVPQPQHKDGAAASTSQGRRNLAEALNNMRSDSAKGSASEVYTRSLLWDQIPSDVVRSFAKMVVECHQAQAAPGSRLDDDL